MLKAGDIFYEKGRELKIIEIKKDGRVRFIISGTKYEQETLGNYESFNNILIINGWTRAEEEEVI